MAVVSIIEKVLNIPFSSSDFEIVFPACQVSSQPFSSQTCTWQGSINGSYTTKFNSSNISINTNILLILSILVLILILIIILILILNTNTNINITINIDNSTLQGSINGSYTIKLNSTNINTYINIINTTTHNNSNTPININTNIWQGSTNRSSTTKLKNICKTNLILNQCNSDRNPPQQKLVTNNLK